METSVTELIAKVYLQLLILLYLTCPALYSPVRYVYLYPVLGSPKGFICYIWIPFKSRLILFADFNCSSTLCLNFFILHIPFSYSFHLLHIHFIYFIFISFFHIRTTFPICLHQALYFYFSIFLRSIPYS